LASATASAASAVIFAQSRAFEQVGLHHPRAAAGDHFGERQ